MFSYQDFRTNFNNYVTIIPDLKDFSWGNMNVFQEKQRNNVDYPLLHVFPYTTRYERNPADYSYKTHSFQLIVVRNVTSEEVEEDVMQALEQLANRIMQQVLFDYDDKANHWVERPFTKEQVTQTITADRCVGWMFTFKISSNTDICSI